MNEKLLEKKLRKAVEGLHGAALKISSPYFTGLPDRLILMPRGRMYWAEIKTTGQTLRPKQSYVIRYLINLEFDVWIIDTEETLNQFIKHIQTF